MSYWAGYSRCWPNRKNVWEYTRIQDGNEIVISIVLKWYFIQCSVFVINIEQNRTEQSSRLVLYWCFHALECWTQTQTQTTENSKTQTHTHTHTHYFFRGLRKKYVLCQSYSFDHPITSTPLSCYFIDLIYLLIHINYGSHFLFFIFCALFCRRIQMRLNLDHS